VILVLTSDNDRTADRVVDELRRRRASVQRFDLADFPRCVRVSARTLADGGPTGWTGWIDTGELRVPWDEVTSVYYRRPTGFVFPDNVVGSDLVFATAEARRGLGGLLLSLPVRWVNNPAKVADAEFKPAQLAVAAACHMIVPRTLLTNDPDQARAFCAEIGGAIVYKPLSAANIVDDHEVRLVFTTPITPAEFNDEDIALTMNMFQEWVPKRFDARVTVFGNDVFGVAIHAGLRDAYIDWRVDYSSLSYERIEVPRIVADGIAAYMKRFDLLFGAFDFAVTDDAWYFLECNSNGQFGWIEAETGLPMTASLVELLTGAGQ
jgi:ATP-grasp ribosomal peptide maturase